MYLILIFQSLEVFMKIEFQVQFLDKIRNFRNSYMDVIFAENLGTRWIHVQKNWELGLN